MDAMMVEHMKENGFTLVEGPADQRGLIQAGRAASRSITTKYLRTGSSTSNRPVKPAGITHASPGPNSLAAPASSLMRMRPLIT